MVRRQLTKMRVAVEAGRAEAPVKGRLKRTIRRGRMQGKGKRKPDKVKVGGAVVVRGAADSVRDVVPDFRTLKPMRLSNNSSCRIRDRRLPMLRLVLAVST